MNILITNDDGIGCEGILRLAEALRELRAHTIYVLAPDGDRSGVSHCLSFFKPIPIRDRGNNTWTCAGSPADCVMVAALSGFPVKPDLVVSGINAGANLGTDVIYSGTASAAREAALHGIPALAFSLASLGGTVYWERAAAYARDHLEELLSLWKEDTFINVNIPNSPDYPSVPEITYPSRRNYGDALTGFDAPDGNRYYFLQGVSSPTGEEPGSDEDAVSRNRISVSPIFIHPVVRRDLCVGAPEYCAVPPRLSKAGAKG